MVAFALCLGLGAALRVGQGPRPIQLRLAATSAAAPALQPALVLAALSAVAIVEPAAASDVSWIAPTKAVLAPTLTIGTVLFLMRVVLSWFPKYDLNELPWSIAAKPTEPLLKPTRMVIPPVAGVDISPLVWVAFLSFCSEILLGPQGLLTILQRKG
jgi:YggT family protein